ncbi:hypothetical protein D3C73_1019650 [compost metagenome]
MVGIPDILFTIYRDTEVIFTAISSNVSLNEVFNITLHTIDDIVPVGYYGYSLTAQVIAGLPLVNNAVVIGPIMFSGVSYAPVV